MVDLKSGQSLHKPAVVNLSTLLLASHFRLHIATESTSEKQQRRKQSGGAMAEVEDTLKRIQTHKGVIGTIVVNAEGIPIRTTLDNSTTVQYAGLLHQLTMKARSTVRDIDPQNDLTFLRIRSKKHEIMVAPDKEYLLIVIQNPSE
ncbi:dynein light chain roadblock-type 2 [Astyanax mexicanus]|uniref:Dynein light chain roadblock-type 2 n=2 Tax=Astyanax mexicanus TaxID=7994 RepID=A0A8B9L680_ASTMX|nr:dynein light chain roadblock-type 2 [Astyanax mexicanus]KAG9281071.1 dynein light chain roadblock-type 2 [Astyanax mexicanus]